MGNKGRLAERARYARTHGIVLGGEISVHMLLVPQESGQGANLDWLKSLDVAVARQVCALEICTHRDPFYTAFHVVTTIDSTAVYQEWDCKEEPVVRMTNTYLSNPRTNGASGD